MKTQKMTLDETWKNCLKLWKFVARRVRGHTTVYDLKAEWMDEHNFYGVELNCFFCEASAGNCRTCPGAIIDPDFRCDNDEYDWNNHPIKFYKELVSLNRKRKRQNRKK